MVAWQDCYCLTVEVETLLRIIEEEKASSAYKAELFNEIFPDNTKQSIINFAYFWRERNLTHNEPIFEQGDPSDCIYTLVSGEITVFFYCWKILSLTILTHSSQKRFHYLQKNQDNGKNQQAVQQQKPSLQIQRQL